MQNSLDSKKNIALLTWAPDENYGTALQCAALNIFIKKLGYNVTTIYYVPQRKQRPLLFRYIIKCFKIIFFGLSGKEIVKYEKQKYRHDRFIKFKEGFYNHTPIISQENELVALVDNFSAFVCGSDQIWNPSFFNPHYFLDFVHDSNKKIAYAPSFGTENIDNSGNAKKILPLVKDFAFLSCREESGAKWLTEKLRKKIPSVLDPTLLLKKEDWHAISNISYNIPEHYILCYFLGFNPKYWKVVKDFARRKQLRIVVLPIYRRDFWRMQEIKKDAGPCEFLTLFGNADYICTDSFHGCIFSVIYEKNFVPFLRFSETDEKNQNSRVENLLEKLGLKNRIFSNSKSLEDIFSFEIDYISVNTIINQERKKSVDYLQNALQLVTGGLD